MPDDENPNPEQPIENDPTDLTPNPDPATEPAADPPIEPTADPAPVEDPVEEAPPSDAQLITKAGDLKVIAGIALGVLDETAVAIAEKMDVVSLKIAQGKAMLREADKVNHYKYAFQAALDNVTIAEDSGDLSIVTQAETVLHETKAFIIADLRLGT